MSDSENSKINLEEPQERRKEISAYEKNKERLKSAYSTKVTDSPCIRSTALTSKLKITETKNHLFFFKGIPSSIVAGLLTYLVTSRSRWAIHSSFITYFGVSVVYFKICYDEYKHTLKQNKEVGEIMDLIVKYRGTEMEDKLREQYKDKVSRMDVKSKFV